MTQDDAETLVTAAMQLATIAAPIYAWYSQCPMKKSEAMELAVKDAAALAGCASYYIRGE